MKWLLIYGFDVIIYKKAPTVRIFIEDILINEFTLEKKMSAVVEFEYNGKDKNKLTIEFLNDDNNYNNGFMSKYTSIIPLHLYIVPDYIVKNYSQLWLRYEGTFSKSNYYMYRKKRSEAYANINPKYANTHVSKKGLEYIKHYYKTRASCPQNIFALGGDDVSVSDEYTLTTGWREYHNLEHNLVSNCLYGKSKKYNYVLDKKHNMMFYQIKPKGFVIFEHYSKPIFEQLEKIYQ
tara:strand:+ start:205 stop:909 length:705 start_codon:yes stop_codon:yes gene_type:complete